MTDPDPPLYTASVPVFLRYCDRLRCLQARAVAHAESTATPVATLFAAKPMPQMLAFGVQAQIVCNFALRAAYPLAGLPRPDYGEFADDPIGLAARIAYVERQLHALPPSAFAEAAGRIVHDRAGKATIALPGDAFLHTYALPNFFFHLGAAYIALRAAGVPLGKADYDGLHVY
jgi:uncharacterized protein